MMQIFSNNSNAPHNRWFYCGATLRSLLLQICAQKFVEWTQLLIDNRKRFGVDAIMIIVNYTISSSKFYETVSADLCAPPLVLLLVFK